MPIPRTQKRHPRNAARKVLGRNSDEPQTKRSANIHSADPHDGFVDEMSSDTEPVVPDVTDIAPKAIVLTESVVSQDHDSAILESIKINHDKEGMRYPAATTTQGRQVNYSAVSAASNAQVYNGDIYHQYFSSNEARNAWHHEETHLGFDFSLSSSYNGTQQCSAFEAARKNRSTYTVRKRPVLPALLDHQKAYKSYTDVTHAETRTYLVHLARLFADLDEFFAAMFVHIMLASETSTLSEDLAEIRREISTRQISDSAPDDYQNKIYLGDLGHHCEALLKQYEQASHKHGDTRSVSEFRSTHSDEQSWIDYLEDGFEIPYWKMMLDAFSTSRLNKPTLGGKVISTALISMRSDVLDLRSRLQKVLSSMPEHEEIEDILSVVDKRIMILRSFTDCVVQDKHILGRQFESSSSILVKTFGKTHDTKSKETSEAGGETSSASDPLLLVTLVLLTLIAATVPFALGFKFSNETGKTSDADFWLNISSSIFTIMANFVMIIQLTQGSRFSKQYMHVWIWFFLGIVCASISVAIYPFCNTAWSSLVSFFATIAGFGATLSVAMTVGRPHSDAPPPKKSKNE